MAKKPKKKLTPQEIEQRSFRKKIQSIFRNMGFQYLNTNGKHRMFGSQKGELDFVFLFENIIIVCEDTVTKSSGDIKDHLRKKHSLFDQIRANKSDFIVWLKDTYKEQFGTFQDYVGMSRYHIYYLYASKYPPIFSEEDYNLFPETLIVEDDDLSYFQKITANIKISARNEFFRFLDLSNKDIGDATGSTQSSEIKIPIIVPEDNTRLQCKARIVSFMMSAEKLMQNAYVLRKDNWEESMGLYQRLIEKGRIQSIRNFLAKNQETFLNNIIVTLPDNVEFEDGNGKRVNIDSISDFEKYKMVIPDVINSICIIDGQHRIYAHYEGYPGDAQEVVIGKLRKKLHLLVTGLIFPTDIGIKAKRKAESEIFLNINSNSKPVPPDVLLHIETLKDPYSDLGIAREVLKRLNKKAVFVGLFQLSLIKKAHIKIPSIIKFALRYLVDANDKKETFFKYWIDEERKKKFYEDESLLEDYINFCVSTLELYFSALKEVFKAEWDDKDNSKILSTTAINGFIIAIRVSLKHTGTGKTQEFYRDAFKKLVVNFSKKDFPYTSSQYAKFSKKILKDCFNIEEESV